jgi:hypothetical protein
MNTSIFKTLIKNNNNDDKYDGNESHKEHSETCSMFPEKNACDLYQQDNEEPLCREPDSDTMSYSDES